MTQSIYNHYNALIVSEEMNARFSDILGGSIISGYRLIQGSGTNQVSLVRNGDSLQVLVTWTGVKVVENDDLYNVATCPPNPTNVDRLDSIYVTYQHGEPVLPAHYVVITGQPTGEAAPEADRSTHTLIGQVRIPANNAPLALDCFISRPFGLSKLNVSGPAVFADDVSMKKNSSVGGNFTVTGNDTVHGNSVVDGDEVVSGNATVHKNLQVDGPINTNDPSTTRTNLNVFSKPEAQGAIATAIQQYEYTVLTPASEWVITHNLGRFPAVQILDDQHRKVLADIEYDSSNLTRIRFAKPIAGKAYLY